MQEEIKGIADLVAIISFNKLGYKIAMVVCTKDKIEATTKDLYERYPDTYIVAEHEIQLSARNVSYVMDNNKELHKTY